MSRRRLQHLALLTGRADEVIQYPPVVHLDYPPVSRQPSEDVP